MTKKTSRCKVLCEECQEYWSYLLSQWFTLNFVMKTYTSWSLSSNLIVHSVLCRILEPAISLLIISRDLFACGLCAYVSSSHLSSILIFSVSYNPCHLFKCAWIFKITKLHLPLYSLVTDWTWGGNSSVLDPHPFQQNGQIFYHGWTVMC